VQLFGRQTEVIVDMAYNQWPQHSDKSKVIEFAVLEYCRHFEMSLTPSDYYIRRKSLFHFDIKVALDEFEQMEEAWMVSPLLREALWRELKYELYREADRIQQGWAL
jgi:hypothetical protein